MLVITTFKNFSPSVNLLVQLIAPSTRRDGTESLRSPSSLLLSLFSSLLSSLLSSSSLLRTSLAGSLSAGLMMTVSDFRLDTLRLVLSAGFNKNFCKGNGRNLTVSDRAEIFPVSSHSRPSSWGWETGPCPSFSCGRS